MKVLICGSSMGEYGGIEAVMFSKAQYLHREECIQCTLAFKLVKGYQIRPSLKERIDETEIPIHVLNRMDGKLLKLIQSVDVVHTQNVPPDIVFFCKLLGKPIVSLTHNFRSPKFSPHNLIWKFGNLICDYVTYNSSFVQSTWNQNFIRNCKSRVIPALSKLPDQHKVGGNRKGFVFISRWIENKGADLLIDAYSKANLNKADWPLVMMGDGPLRKTLQNKVQLENIEGIQILGRVSEEEKNQRICQAKWIVVPPNTNEDMGLTPIEGRQMGTPVIASRDGGVPESAGEYALFFEPGNTQQLRQKLEEAAQIEEIAYLETAKASQISLSNYLYPLSIYLEIYHTFLGVSKLGDLQI